ncbi:MAG: amidohydrolase [Acidimicrobiia bacterium]|nr:amidohydrolase [Acidimicrobiia bacterium]
MLLPDPDPWARFVPIVSVDDHLIEPPHLFEGRVPAHLAARAPRVVEAADGSQLWEFDDRQYPNIGLNAVVGRPRDEWSMEPARFDEMRRGCWDIKARVADMDVAGIWASVCFPSLLPGFAGTIFARCSDAELGLACVRAWNDWHLEEWAGGAPDRIIPIQIPWLADPRVAATEVVRNAARGFRAVSFAENPANLRLPSVHTRHWDPLLAACEETGTVLCLHTGSSAWSAVTSPEAPLELITTLFPVNSLAAAADWIWAGIPLRFPDLRITLAEGGIGWVPMLLDRLEYVVGHSGTPTGRWARAELTPAEALLRNFSFCTLDDPSTIALWERIGADRIMVETDYPHADSTWPDSQGTLERTCGALPRPVLEAVAWRNACRLFDHAPPPAGF